MLKYNWLGSHLHLFRISAIILCMLTPAGAPTAAERWPLGRAIDLSSGFGDFRDGHFHAGLDLRTGGKIGAEVVAPVDGYIWRIKMSYWGYGKGLYLMGDDGHLYVFGHLSKFAANIDRRVKIAQVAEQRYYQDLYLKDDEIRVKQGDFLAYSGQSGAGGPHLHFEERSGSGNVPLNPLTHGLILADNVRPSLTRIGFQMTDENSLFANGRRKLFFDLAPTGQLGQYRTDTLLYFSRPFGLLVDGFDRMREGGMQQAIWSYQVYLDEQLVYQVRYDSLAFETTISVLQEYDYTEANQGRKRTRRLFCSPGNVYPGSGAIGGGAGILGDDIALTTGRHQLKILAEDCLGNRSEAGIGFIWGPDTIFDLVSSGEVAPDTTEFVLSRNPRAAALSFDSVKVLLNRKEQWGEPSGLKTRLLPDGTLRIRAAGHSVERAILRVFAFVDDCSIADNVFNGLLEKAPDRCSIYHEVVQDGLLVHVDARVINGALGHIRLYDGERLLGVEFLQFLDMVHHVCFVPPRPEYDRITRIGVCMNRDTTSEVWTFSDTLAIYQVGRNAQEFIDYDGYLYVRTAAEDFHQPRFIEIRSSKPNRIALSLNSAHYQIFPEAIEYQRDFELGLLVPSVRVNAWVSGICWLDAENNKWIWLDNELRGDTLWAPTHGGGSFAAVFDNDPPLLQRMTVFDGATYRDPNKRIGFAIVDTLSGIGDERDIVVKIDGQWLPADYDFETGYCQAWPLEPLSEGSHHLGIVVIDRAGQRTEQYLNFIVKP
ncbi:MAG: M23 family metallopeptidase [bacterium]